MRQDVLLLYWGRQNNMQALFTQPVKQLMITNNSPGEMSYLIASMEQISKEFPLERSVTPTDLAVVRPLMSLEWG